MPRYSATSLCKTPFASRSSLRFSLYFIFIYSTNILVQNVLKCLTKYKMYFRIVVQNVSLIKGKIIMKEVKEQPCLNCREFTRFYVKTDIGFRIEQCGFCTNTKLHYQTRIKKSKSMEGCEHWEQLIDRKEERLNNIKSRLERLMMYIEGVYYLLENELNE